jgi:hypothetical protein
MLAKLKPMAWETLPTDIKSHYTIVGYIKARNYCKKCLFELTLPELEQFEDEDIQELFMKALEGLTVIPANSNNPPVKKRGKK